MCANIAFTDRDSSARRRTQRLRFANGKQLDMKDMKVVLDIIIGPSLQLWKLGATRGVIPKLKRSPKPVVADDNASNTSSETLKKKVRFDEKPVTMSRRWFFERPRKSSGSSPLRPCLVIRERDDVALRHKSPKPSVEKDSESRSVYEDSLSYHPDFVFDMEMLPGNMSTRKHVRRSDFYEIEDGVAVFDHTGYANYCLSKRLEKQREEAWAPRKRVFEDPILPPNQALSPLPLATNSPAIVRSAQPFTVVISRPPQSLPLRVWKHIDDELHNAMFVVTVGLFIHICLYLFFLYDILTRGLFPSDD